MRRAGRLMLPALCLATGALAGCAEQSCANPYVLDFVDSADRRASLAHVGLIRDAVRTDPGARPSLAHCTVWERVRNPAYGVAPNQPEVLLQPQHFSVTKIDDGWRVGP